MKTVDADETQTPHDSNGVILLADTEMNKTNILDPTNILKRLIYIIIMF